VDSLIFILVADYADGERELMSFADARAAREFVDTHWDGRAMVDDLDPHIWRVQTGEAECRIELSMSRLRDTGED